VTTSQVNVAFGPEDVGVFMSIGGAEVKAIALALYRKCLLRMVVESVGHLL